MRDNYGSRDTRGNDRYQERRDRDTDFPRDNSDRSRSYNKGGYLSENTKVDPRMKYASRNDTRDSLNERNRD